MLENRLTLHILTGAMYSSKSSRLLSILHTHSLNQNRKKIITIKPLLDTRSPGKIASRTGESYIADFSVQSLSSIPLPNASSPDTIYGIDECQFFQDLIPFHDNFFTTARQNGGNHTLVLAGLDLDFNKRPFGSLLELATRSLLHSTIMNKTSSAISVAAPVAPVIADEVIIERLSARCMYQKEDGQMCNAPALFSQRLSGGNLSIVLIEGGKEGEGGYAPHCERHHRLV